MMLRKLFRFVSLMLFAILLFPSGCVSYPETFPGEWKKCELISHSSKLLAPGVTYYHYHAKDLSRGKPLSFYLIVVEWDKTEGQIGLRVAGESKGRATVPRMLKSRRDVVAAVNGSYFHMRNGYPYFALKAEGNLQEPYKKGNRFSSSGLVANGNEFPQIVKMTPEILEKYDNVIQGYWLGRNGKSIFTKQGTDRTPYTVAGINPEKRILILFVNDGRHPKDSPGIAFSEIPEYLFKLGATEVLSLDGGGSSTMALPGEDGILEVVNHPSDNGRFDHKGARAVQSALMLVKTIPPPVVKVPAEKSEPIPEKSTIAKPEALKKAR